ncbi:hypothetical protein TNCV_3291611 [Trichonephila clavipes]|nr:hypothetical protein TNCV_3291611 [Trichonephila clavipes]
MAKKTRTLWAKSKGRSLSLLLFLESIAVYNGMSFTPWVTLPGDYHSNVLHPFRPGTPPPLAGNKHTLRRPAGLEEIICDRGFQTDRLTSSLNSFL